MGGSGSGVSCAATEPAINIADTATGNAFQRIRKQALRSHQLSTEWTARCEQLYRVRVGTHLVGTDESGMDAPGSMLLARKSKPAGT